MPVNAVTPILNVSSVSESLAWFEALGWVEGFVWPQDGDPTFGGVCSNGAEIFLCRGAQGARGEAAPRFPGDEDTGGVWMSWWVGSPAEVDEMYAIALAGGMSVSSPPRDEPWGVREFHLRHPDGHTFRVSAGTGGE